MSSKAALKKVCCISFFSISTLKNRDVQKHSQTRIKTCPKFEGMLQLNMARPFYWEYRMTKKKWTANWFVLRFAIIENKGRRTMLDFWNNIFNGNLTESFNLMKYSNKTWISLRNARSSIRIPLCNAVRNE